MTIKQYILFRNTAYLVRIMWRFDSLMFTIEDYFIENILIASLNLNKPDTSQGCNTKYIIYVQLYYFASLLLVSMLVLFIHLCCVLVSIINWYFLICCYPLKLTRLWMNANWRVSCDGYRTGSQLKVVKVHHFT